GTALLRGTDPVVMQAVVCGTHEARLSPCRFVARANGETFWHPSGMRGLRDAMFRWSFRGKKRNDQRLPSGIPPGCAGFATRRSGGRSGERSGTTTGYHLASLRDALLSRRDVPVVVPGKEAERPLATVWHPSGMRCLRGATFRWSFRGGTTTGYRL